MEVERFDHGWVRFLRRSSELCIFAARAGILVVVPWYVFIDLNFLAPQGSRRPLKPDGTKFTPRELVALLDREDLYFPCYCSHMQGIPYGCEITGVKSVEGAPAQDQRVFLYCHFESPRCSFFGLFNSVF